jgi:3-oxoacyl-[acyl-carrier-protein] synthase II
VRRVVITGIGLLTPLGVGMEAAWQALLEGRSAVAPLRGFDPSVLHSQLGAEIADFTPEEYVANRRILRNMTRTDQLALVGATLAVRDAGVDFAAHAMERAGLFIGSNKEVCDLMRLQDAMLESRGADGVVDIRKLGECAGSIYPLFYVEGLQAAALFFISQAFGLKGANTYFAGIADAGAIAIGSAYRTVRRGEADVAIAGGYDDAVSWWHMTKFDGLGMLTPRNDLGASACRPYDRDRSGTVMGEGAAFVVLEAYEAAARRGARIYAELTGFGIGNDAYKLITPHPEGRGLAHAMRAALREAGAPAEAIQYVASHGSGTRLGDRSEARALRGVFGPAADGLAASSVKPATGHLAGAAGALNVAVAALAVHGQAVPPTLNLEHPDPRCLLDWVPLEGREMKVEQALAVARGFEGQNVALALRAV